MEHIDTLSTVDTPVSKVGDELDDLRTVVLSWESRMIDSAPLMSDGTRASVVGPVITAKERLKRTLGARLCRFGWLATEMNQADLQAALIELDEAMERSAGKVIGLVTGPQK